MKYIILGLYILFIVGIAAYSRKKSTGVNDFLLGGRKIGGWMSAFAYGTTYFSAVIFIGYAGNMGYNLGMWSLLVGVGNALIGCLLAWLVFAKRTRVITRHLNARTMPEFFGIRYQDKWLKLVCALVIAVFLIPYAASVYRGLGLIFKVVFNIDLLWVILIMAALTAIYIFFGGYFATALTGFVQGIVMLGGVAIMIIFVWRYQAVNSVLELGKSPLSLGFLAGKKGAVSWYTLIMTIFLTSLGAWGLPQMINKFYAIKDTAAIRRATTVSTVICLVIGVGAYFIGCLARFVIDPSVSSDSRIPQLLVEALPAGMLGLIAVLLLSASMSTLDSLSLVIGGSCAVDIFKGYIKKDASDKLVGIVMRVSCMVAIAISAFIAILFDKPGSTSMIVTLMSLSWGALSGCFIGPYLYGLYSKKVNRVGAYASVACALVATLVLYLVSSALAGDPANGIAAKPAAPYFFAPAIGVFCMVLSLIVTPLASLFGKPPAIADTLPLLNKDISAAAEPVAVKS